MAYGDNLEVFASMPSARIAELLQAVSGVRAALLGDLSLDAYWTADMTQSELSRETPHYPLPIVEERYSPGAGGNAAANIAALQPKSLCVIGATGQDWRGDVLTRELATRSIDTSFIVRHPGIMTNAYIKPCRRGLSEQTQEDARLDFANRVPQPADLEALLIGALERAAPDIDVLCVSDQFRHGSVTAPVREKIVRLAKTGLKVVVDSREHIGLFPGCILKPNELEGARAAGMERICGQRSAEGFAAAAEELARRAGSPVCMTLGANGCLVAAKGALCLVPAAKRSPPLDICGAGDTFLAAFGCSLAAGAAMREAAYIANLASGVTVKKLGQTGTASREEILAQCMPEARQ